MMSTQKIAITIPKGLIPIIDQMSQKKGISRSKFVTNVLKEKIQQEQGRYLQDAYNRVFSEEDVRKEQLATAQWFEGAESREGQEW